MDKIWSLRPQFDAPTRMISLESLYGNVIAYRILGTLIGSGLILKLNAILSNWACNNYSTNCPWDWEKEIVLITGGSSGIGEQVVHKLAKRDIKVIVFDIASPTTPFPLGVSYYKVDISDREAVSKAAKELREDVGKPTVLINNAGIGILHSTISATDEMNRRIFDVNVLAQFILVKEFAPSMIKNDHGHIVTISSMSSFSTIAGNVAYSCSKAASLAFHEGLRQELTYLYNAKHIRTSIVHPLWVRTPMNNRFNKRFVKDLLEPSDVADRIVKQVLSGKSGRIILPDRLWFAPLVRGLPDWIQEWVRGSRSGLIPVRK